METLHREWFTDELRRIHACTEGTNAALRVIFGQRQQVPLAAARRRMERMAPRALVDGVTMPEWFGQRKRLTGEGSWLERVLDWLNAQPEYDPVAAAAERERQRAEWERVQREQPPYTGTWQFYNGNSTAIRITNSSNTSTSTIGTYYYLTV